MRLLLTVLFSVVFICSAEAKYNRPENTETRADKDARYMFKYMDKDNDGKLTLQEYKSKFQTRDVRRKERAKRKKGTYRSPEEEFKMMDQDEKGFVTEDELRSYLNSLGQDY